MAKGIRVTAEDLETGEKVTREIVPGDYMVLAVKPCYVDSFAHYPTGTAQLTIKGRHPQKAGE